MDLGKKENGESKQTPAGGAISNWNMAKKNKAGNDQI